MRYAYGVAMALAQKEKEELGYNVSAKLIKHEGYIDKGFFYKPQMSINENGKEAYIDIGLRDGIHVIRLKVKFNKPADIKKIIDTFKKITVKEGERYKKYLKNITEKLRKEKGRRYSLSGRGLAAAIRSAAKNNCYVYKEEGINGTTVSANDYLKYGSVANAYNAGDENEEEPVQYVTFKETDKDYVGNIKPRGILLGTARNEKTGKNRNIILGKVVVKPGGKGVQKEKRGKKRKIRITAGKPIITSGPRKVAKLGTPTRKRRAETKKRRKGKKNRK